MYITRAQGIQYTDDVLTMNIHGPVGFAAALYISAMGREDICTALMY